MDNEDVMTKKYLFGTITRLFLTPLQTNIVDYPAPILTPFDTFDYFQVLIKMALTVIELTVSIIKTFLGYVLRT